MTVVLAVDQKIEGRIWLRIDSEEGSRYVGIPRHGPQQGVVDGEVPHLDLGERRRRAAHRPARGADPAGCARDGAGSMLGQDAELVLAWQFRMLGHDGPQMKDQEAAGAAMSVNGTE